MALFSIARYGITRDLDRVLPLTLGNRRTRPTATRLSGASLIWSMSLVWACLLARRQTRPGRPLDLAVVYLEAQAMCAPTTEKAVEELQASQSLLDRSISIKAATDPPSGLEPTPSNLSSAVFWQEQDPRPWADLPVLAKDSVRPVERLHFSMRFSTCSTRRTLVMEMLCTLRRPWIG